MPPRNRYRRRKTRERRRQLAVLAVMLGACIFVARNEPANVSMAMTETEALARVIRSEIGSGTPEQKLHIAWAARNLAREKHKTVVQMACSPCGRQQRGRPVSSRQPARDEDRRLARIVLALPDVMDPTGGATHFINPVLQDRLARSGRVSGYRGQTYKRVRRRWIRKYGWEPYYRLGSTLELWGPKRGI